MLESFVALATVAATTEFHDNDPFPGTERTAEVRLHESGRIVLASHRAVVFPSAYEPQIFELAIVGHTDLIVRLAALVSQKYSVAGSWRFGLVVSGFGVRDGTSFVLAQPPMYETGPKYLDDTYQRATSASLAELEDAPQRVVYRLVSRLLRSLGSHQQFDWVVDS